MTTIILVLATGLIEWRFEILLAELTIRESDLIMA